MAYSSVVREPVAIAQIVAAIAIIAASFGFNTSEEVQAAVVVIVLAITGLVARSKVTPV